MFQHLRRVLNSVEKLCECVSVEYFIESIYFHRQTFFSTRSFHQNYKVGNRQKGTENILYVMNGKPFLEKVNIK